MAVYFFHLRGGRIDAHDHEGTELADATAARRQAVLNARDIMAEEVKEGRLPLHERIDVHDGEGLLLFSVPFRSAIDIAD